MPGFLDQRIVRMPGEALLPPSAVPLVPGDIGDDEKVVVYPPLPPWLPRDAAELTALLKDPGLQDQRYWGIKQNYQNYPNALTWTNEPDMPRLYGYGRGVATLTDLPVFRYRFRQGKVGNFLDYVELGPSLALIGPGLRDHFLAFDPAGVAVRPARLVDEAGAVVSDEHALIDFVRTVPVVDYANSVVAYHGPVESAGQRYEAWVSAVPSVRMLETAVGLGTILRAELNGRPSEAVLVPDAFRQRILRAKPKPRGLTFQNLASGL